VGKRSQESFVIDAFQEGIENGKVPEGEFHNRQKVRSENNDESTGIPGIGRNGSTEPGFGSCN
jgi:hypothetical protein